MRRSISGLVLFWIILGLIILGIMVAGFAGVSFYSANPVVSEGVTENMAVVDQTLPIDGIKDMNISISASRTTVQHSENSDFRIVQTGHNVPDKMKLEVYKEGSTIRVVPAGANMAKPSNWFNLSFSFDSQVTIYIPADYSENLSLKVSAGNMKIQDDLSLAQLTINMSAGDLSSDAKISADEAKLTMSAGGLDLEHLSAKEYKIGSSAGKVAIESLIGGGKISASAGSVALDSVEITGDTKITSSAGSIHMKLAGDPGLDFKGVTSAGSLRTYFDTAEKRTNSSLTCTVGSAPYHKLQVSSSAGSVDIQKAN